MKEYHGEEEKRASTLAVAKQAKVIERIGTEYLARIDGVGDPAEKELRAAQEKIVNEASFYDFMKV